MRRKGSEPVKFGLTIGRGGTPRLYLARITNASVQNRFAQFDLERGVIKLPEAA
ncbi:hypothetical protein [Streptomyces alboflavus]|uniref:hypothetical protein n=1 Tax=Streptomyces alboflavus TaxID=67267 RepID=UPI001877FE48|nr:hypothetical protein [Streptomyces alboflavus]